MAVYWVWFLQEDPVMKCKPQSQNSVFAQNTACLYMYVHVCCHPSSVPWSRWQLYCAWKHRAQAESTGQVGIAHIRTVISQGVSLFLFLQRLNQELPVLGHSSWGAAEQVCGAWSKVRALSGKECSFTFYEPRTQLDLEVGPVEVLAETRGPNFFFFKI